MNFPKRKIVRWSFIFIVGVTLGGIVTLHLLINIYSYYRIKEDKISTRHAIITPYAVLAHLRKKDTKNAIKRLEFELDSGLFSLAYEKKYISKDGEIETEPDRIMLKKIREYRTKYPQTSEIPVFEKAIKNLLFPNRHNLKNKKADVTPP